MTNKCQQSWDSPATEPPMYLRKGPKFWNPKMNNNNRYIPRKKQYGNEKHNTGWGEQETPATYVEYNTNIPAKSLEYNTNARAPAKSLEYNTNPSTVPDIDTFKLPETKQWSRLQVFQKLKNSQDVLQPMELDDSHAVNINIPIEVLQKLRVSTGWKELQTPD